MLHLWIVGEKINRGGSYEACSNVTFNSWLGRKDVWFLSFQLAKFFCDMIRGVMSKRMDKRSHAWPRGKLIFAVYIFIFLYTFCCLPQPTALDLFLVNWLTKHTNKTLHGGRASSASRLDSNLFEEGWEGRVQTKRRNGYS